jgi:hypothetical protein
VGQALPLAKMPSPSRVACALFPNGMPGAAELPVYFPQGAFHLPKFGVDRNSIWIRRLGHGGVWGSSFAYFGVFGCARSYLEFTI